MLELDNATQAAKQRIQALEAALDVNTTNLEAEKTKKSQLQGRIEELETQLTMAQNLRDQYLRWSVELTRQIHSIGMFANEAMRLARTELANSGKATDLSRTNGDVLKTLEAELKETVTGLGEEMGSDPERPIPSFLRAGPRPHSF